MMADIAMQCAMDFAETAARFGHCPDTEDLWMDVAREKYLERRRIAAQARRTTARIQKQRWETRTCPCCKTTFRVLAHGSRGRPRVFCCCLCRERFKKRLSRRQKRAIAVRTKRCVMSPKMRVLKCSGDV